MKIGIIVHSHTGNTLSVAQKIKEKLLTAGHSVNLEQVTAVNEDSVAAGKIQLKTIPDVSTYDILIFGAPVNGFSLSQVMKEYLLQIPSWGSMRKPPKFLTGYFSTTINKFMIIGYFIYGCICPSPRNI